MAAITSSVKPERTGLKASRAGGRQLLGPPPPPGAAPDLLHSCGDGQKVDTGTLSPCMGPAGSRGSLCSAQASLKKPHSNPPLPLLPDTNLRLLRRNESRCAATHLMMSRCRSLLHLPRSRSLRLGERRKKKGGEDVEEKRVRVTSWRRKTSGGMCGVTRPSCGKLAGVSTSAAALHNKSRRCEGAPPGLGAGAQSRVDLKERHFCPLASMLR
ncbi:unnamed protein product [Pleuronectes platessa]|uniref:Uncharacterized protein n=1 Tax=Pleuronectes platessa TaxID=8262 RepID=A0A9N7Z7S8_PLEPL|nr:unnamed protein product [Pleuronectes platessa]